MLHLYQIEPEFRPTTGPLAGQVIQCKASRIGRDPCMMAVSIWADGWPIDFLSEYHLNGIDEIQFGEFVVISAGSKRTLVEALRTYNPWFTDTSKRMKTVSGVWIEIWQLKKPIIEKLKGVFL